MKHTSTLSPQFFFCTAQVQRLPLWAIFFCLVEIIMFIASWTLPKRFFFYFHSLIMATFVCAKCFSICKKNSFIRCGIYVMCLNTGEHICRRQYIQWILYTCSICRVIWSSINEWGLIKEKHLVFKEFKRCFFSVLYLFCCF